MENLMNFDEVRDVIIATSFGETVDVCCLGRTIKAVSENIDGITWSQRGLYDFRVTRSPSKMINAKKSIESIIKAYDGGQIEAPFPHHYVRQIVSLYNRKYLTEFRVTVKSGKAFIYAEPRSKVYITEAEYNDVLEQYRTELNALRKKVRPDSFFEMSKDDFDNGIPEVKSEDMEVIDVPAVKAQPYTMVDCEGCGITIPSYGPGDNRCGDCSGSNDDDEDDWNDII